VTLSFSLDFAGVFNTASQIMTGLFPVLIIPLGITLGVGLVNFLAKSFKNII
jgi:hypothetical protein